MKIKSIQQLTKRYVLSKHIYKLSTIFDKTTAFDWILHNYKKIPGKKKLCLKSSSELFIYHKNMQLSDFLELHNDKIIDCMSLTNTYKDLTYTLSINMTSFDIIVEFKKEGDCQLQILEEIETILNLI